MWHLGSGKFIAHSPERLNTVNVYSIVSKMGDKNALTKRQEEIYSFLESYFADHQVAPTLQEICNHFGYNSPNAARQHLQLIAKKGFLLRLSNAPRALQLRSHRPVKNRSEATKDLVSVPLLGRIAAGHPLFALENVEDTLELPKQLFRGRKLFALRVQGDSMIGAGIFNGDLAILAAQPEFKDGEIAAIVVDEEATLKRLYRTPKGLRIKAENPVYPDRFISGDAGKNCRLAGVLVGTIRRF
jgi:repressor LexA